ncbi:MAG: hypothetical protein JO224_00295 [Pelomonas sp.]|nr:hypothetical protein [Roseateles sp.]
MPSPRYFAAAALLCLGALGASAQTPSPHAAHMQMPAATGVDPGRELDPHLGPLHHPVSTTNAAAQAFFDQGMKLAYGFNHEGAIAAFKHAAELDPQLAMAWWGQAWALGSNYNVAMGPGQHAAAYAALGRAEALAAAPGSATTPLEREYIAALATRYASDPKAELEPLNRAYAAAMQALSERHPRDADALTLYAESLMLLHPWRLWHPDGTMEQGTAQVIAALDAALALVPDHVGANHYCIHAWEMAPTPERALPCAHRLEAMRLSAGHLVHMPSHVYIRTGDYAAAARANIAAAQADEALMRAGVHSLYTVGYYGHNLHFLAVAETLAGNSAAAIAAAHKLADMVAPQLKEQDYLDAFAATPAQVLVAFARWDALLALPEPPFEAPLSGMMWHFARAQAFAAKGQAEPAEAERAAFARMADATGRSVDWGNNRALDVLGVARPLLDGRLARMRGDLPAAVAAFREAAAAEDRLAYDEPPNWYLSAHDELGAALLASGDAAGAEAAYRAGLKQLVGSGRSLHGLQAALAAQGRKAEAAAVADRFRRAWRTADVEPVTLK